jgi:MFS family permease
MERAAPARANLFQPSLRALTVGLTLSIVLIAFESLAVSTVLPTVSKELNGMQLYGWSFSAFFLGYLISTVTLGGLADRDGPRTPFTLALVLFGAGLLIAGLAPNMLLFVLGRAVQGLGGGAIGAIAYLAINRAYPDNVRAAMLALLSGAWVLPALIGPLAASLVATQFSWRAIFLGLLPLVVLSAAMTVPALGRLRGHGQPLEAQRVPLAIAVAVGAVLLLTALQTLPLELALILGIVGVSALGFALRRLLPAGTFRVSGALQTGLVTRFLMTFSFLGAEALVPLALGEMRGFSVTSAGLVLSVGALSWSLGSFFQSRLDTKDGAASRPARVRFGFALLTVAMLGMLAVILEAGIPSWLAGAAWLIGGLGMGFAFPSHTLVVFAHAPAGEEGRVSGNLQMVDVLGSALSAGIGGALVAALGVRSGFSLVYGLTILVSSLGVLIAGRLRGNTVTDGL